MLVVLAVVPIPENSSQSTNFSKLINLTSGSFQVFSMMRGTADSGFGRVSEVILLVWGISSLSCKSTRLRQCQQSYEGPVFKSRSTHNLSFTNSCSNQHIKNSPRFFKKGLWVSYIYQFTNRNIDGEMFNTICVCFNTVLCYSSIRVDPDIYTL